MQKNTLLILLASIIAISAGIFVRSLSETADQAVLIPALKFSLPDVTGKQRNQSEWQGKIRIINFWATWCPPCLEEIPEFIKLQTEYSDKNLQFIGIAIEDKLTVQQYLKDNPTNYPILIGGDEAVKLSQQLGNIVNAVPFSLILNQQGQIIHRQPGELSREKIIEIISPLIQ